MPVPEPAFKLAAVPPRRPVLAGLAVRLSATLPGRILLVGASLVAIFIGLAQFDIGGLAVLWENIHWNVASLAAVIAAGLAARSAVGREGSVRMAAFAALALYELYTIGWTIQVASRTAAFPSPVDIVGLSVVIPAISVVVLSVHGRLSTREEAAVYLDFTLVATAIVSLLLVFFGRSAFAMGGLAAVLAFTYPVFYFGMAGAGLVALVAIRQPVAPRGGFALLVGAAVLGIAYLGWVIPAATGTDRPGTLAGHLFSVGVLIVGFGAATWREAAVRSIRYESIAARASRIIGPLTAGVTLLALLPMIGQVDPLDGPIRLTIMLAGSLILARQALLLHERSTMLAEVRALHAENDRLVAELRAELTERVRIQDQLIKASRLAAIGELAAGVAHEVNNPLTGILGHAEILLEDLDPDDRRRDDAQTIREQALRARAIVRALRDFARPALAEKTATDLADLTTRTVDLIRHPLVRSGVTIVESHADLPRIELDSHAIQQVILNVLTNAMQAMPEGGTLRVTSAREGSHVLVTIVDNGVGMDETVVAQAFQPFFSGRPGSGAPGLGLSASLGLIEGHGGTIGLRSSPGVGTTVEIRLPLEATPMAEA